MYLDGATSAYRGYRLQALYVLARILLHEASQNLIFRPEGKEDLDILSQNGELIETVQVKAYTNDLTLSDFSPVKAASFFRRAVELSKQHTKALIKIVSFGLIGQEMMAAWQKDGLARKSIIKKLVQTGFSSSDIDLIFRMVQLEKVEEDYLQIKIYIFLKESLVGGDPDHAFDLLNHWLYLISEKKKEITYKILIEKINNVGRYLVERNTYHQEWFTSICPIEDNQGTKCDKSHLAEEFYQGIAARYEHILAGVDIIRQKKLADIDAALRKTQVVIIHGASGQGKSTLAYRYLHDFIPDLWRFSIRLIESRQHALKIARALSGHAKAIDAPMVIYIDVSPRDRDWPDLVRELSSLHRNINILVTIREEDWRKASIVGADFSFESVSLTFDEGEARELYSLLASRKTPEKFLRFEDAWHCFGCKGPLLEFVFLITQNQLLSERLHKQIQCLQDAVRTGQLDHKELELLRLVSITSAYGARIDLKELVEQLKLLEPKRTIELFEQEYLIRQSPDGHYIEGLHPVRSNILSDLLTDPTLAPWIAAAKTSLPLMVEEDLEIFLLHAFSRRKNESAELLKPLSLHQPKTWTGLANIMGALLWRGIQEYVIENRELITAIFHRTGAEWSFMLDFDVANISPGFVATWWKNLDFIPNQAKKAIEDFQNRQTPKENVFKYLSDWSTERGQAPTHPDTIRDWSSIAEIGFWLGHLHLDSPIISWLTDLNLNKDMDILPLSYLSDVLLGLSFACGEHFYSWLNKNRAAILNRFRRETQTVTIEDDGQSIRAHFFMNMEHIKDDIANNQSASDTNWLHDEAMRRVELLRKLIPDRQSYGCRGYGHKLGFLELSFDDTEKEGVKAKYLLPLWAIQLNAIFRQQGIYHFRPQTWQEHAQAVYRLRKKVINSLDGLGDALNVHFRKKKSVKLLGKYINPSDWDKLYFMTSDPPLFPRCAVDEWGFTGEREKGPKNTETHLLQSQEKEKAFLQQNGLALKQHKPYFSSLKDFTSSLSLFYRQSIDVLIVNTIVGKEKSAKAKATIIQTAQQHGISIDQAHLSTYNLAKAFQSLPQFQKEFRQRFYQFFDKSELEQLEMQEMATLKQIWSLWYQFAFHPGRYWANADQEAIKRLNTSLSELSKGIRINLQKLSGNSIKARILKENISWEGYPTLGVVFDIDNPLDFHNAFESVKSALGKAMRKIESAELMRYALNFIWHSFIIIPLIKGKSLGKFAWKIATISISTTQNNDWWNYMLNPVPSNVWDLLSIETWKHPRLELANQFQGAIIALVYFMAHIVDFDRLPIMDEEGQELLQKYVTAQSAYISETLQKVLDKIYEIVAYYNSLPTEATENRSALMQAMKILIELQENVKPQADLQGAIRMDLNRIKEWMPRLEAAMAQAELFRLCWVTDTLSLPI